MSVPIAILGDFRFDHCTANEYAIAFTELGHQVDKIQEGTSAEHHRLERAVRDREVGLVLWNSAPSLLDRMPPEWGWKFLHLCRRHEIPTVSVHLDQWLQLEREKTIETSAHFHVDAFFGSEGGVAERWEAYEVHHHWLLPAVGKRHLGLAPAVPRHRCKVAFTGSWMSYHPEHPQRREMVWFFTRTFGEDFRALPKNRKPRIVGKELASLYASVDVLIGDSLVMPGISTTSDRWPESLGRGGVLVGPHNPLYSEPDGPFYVEGIPSWEPGDFDDAKRVVDEVLEWTPEHRLAIRRRAIEMMTIGHTYTHRAAAMLETLRAEGIYG